MIHYLPNNAETAKLLQAALRILRDPESWCKGDMKQGDAYYINGALYAAGMPNNPIPEEQFSEDPRYTRHDIKRGDLQESFWFLRQALKLCSDHRSVGRFNDDPATEHHQVIALIHLAFRLVQDEEITYTSQDAA